MLFRFRLNTSPLTQRIERLIEASPRAIREALLAASDEYGEAMRRRFASAKLGDGTWPPLAPSTIKARQAKSETPIETLHVTGSIERSLARGDANHILEQTDNSVIEGTRHRLAGFHHHGTRRVPARTILVPPDEATLEAVRGRLVEGQREALK